MIYFLLPMLALGGRSHAFAVADNDSRRVLVTGAGGQTGENMSLCFFYFTFQMNPIAVNLIPRSVPCLHFFLWVLPIRPRSTYLP